MVVKQDISADMRDAAPNQNTVSGLHYSWAHCGYAGDYSRYEMQLLTRIHAEYVTFSIKSMAKRRRSLGTLYTNCPVFSEVSFIVQTILESISTQTAVQERHQQNFKCIQNAL